MRIQHNIPAMSAYRNYSNNVSAVAKNLEKLSSGYRINRAGDDAAGLAISEKMRAQISGLEQAQSNAKSGINLVQTAEGALTEVHDMLNRMVTLAEQSANGTYDNDVDRVQLQKEVNQLRDEINRIADSANFNGIKLLDGSLDATTGTDGIKADCAISNITTGKYAATGASPAFTASFVTNRPTAATKQTNAVFTVNLDDIKLNGLEATDEVTLEVGGTKITVSLEAADITDMSTVINKLATKGGRKVTTGTDVAEQANDAAATDKADTDTWDTQFSAADENSGEIVKIGGHFYKMAVTSSGGKNTGITFTQVDTIGDKKNINPDFSVKFSSEDKSGTGTGKKELVQSGTVNPQVQVTTTGIAIGSSHQAQAEVELDFSQLKHGDVLTVGEKNYFFKLTTDTNAVSKGSSDTEIDLTTIFKTESDLLDKEKQGKALDFIVKQMGSSGATTWSTGNGGVKDNKGTLTFQSLSTYVDDAANIGDNANNGKCNMTTEDKVMQQFYSDRGAVAAEVSFDVDVTKIKEGDTFTINDTTFEFTAGTYVSDKDNVAIDLKSFGIEGGIPASKTGDVVNQIKTVLGTALSSKYTITRDDNKIKLVSKDDAATGAIDEKKVAAEVTLPKESYTGTALTLQIGDTAEDFNQLKVNVKDCHADAIGIGDIDISTQEGAKAAMDKIKAAVNYVSDVRGDLGATQNRLDHTINNLSVMQENIQDAESTIRDVDVAKEMMAYTKNNILVQSAQAMLAQANQLPQGVLQLLG